MHLQGTFQLDQIRINAASEDAEVKLSLCLQSNPYPSGVHVLPISGFPRCLMSEDGSGVHQAGESPPPFSSLYPSYTRPTNKPPFMANIHTVASMTARSSIQRTPTITSTSTNAESTITSTTTPSQAGTPASPYRYHADNLSYEEGRECLEKLSLRQRMGHLPELEG
jgi:hypothetical protein